MKTLYEQIKRKVDPAGIMEEMKTLTSIEKGQTFRHYHQAVDYIVDLMKRKGIPHAEKLEYPADGVTAYEDKGMPLAWDASIGKITLCDEERTVVADYSTEPFSLIKGSVSTKPGGEILRIITEDQLLAGEDASESLVLLNTSTAPRPQALCTALDLGARGIIADFVTGRMNDVHAVQWVNACTESSSWHIRAEDRDFIGFSINLVMGNLLREKASKGILTARVECDGRRYCGTLPAATALIPGKRPEEVWLLAHTFEPFMDDDASGIIAGIEIARQITAMAEKPEYSLRLIFAMELYGFAAFHANFKGKVIGGANLDTLPGGSHYQFNVVPPITTKPFHGLEFLDEFCSAFNSIIPCKKSTPECFDDMFLSESSTGVPTVWFMAQNRENLTRPEEIRRAGLWHNSIQRESDYLQAPVMADCIAMTGAWFVKTLFHTQEPKALKELSIREKVSPMRQYASEFVFERIHKGLPHDLAYLPLKKRFTLPDGALYGAFTNVLSGMDGKKSVARLVLEAEADRNITLSDEKIFSYLTALNRLADTSYLKVIRRKAVTPEEIQKALAALSVKEGDLLLVHSALSRIGYIRNGAAGVLESLRAAVGREGTVLLPAFTRPYVRLGDGINKRWNFRPYDAKDLSRIVTGSLPKTLLAEVPEAVRSAHISHSWAGVGPQARECLAPHGIADAPCSEHSPLGEALRRNGKVLFFGCGLAPNTFLHYLETVADLPYLGPAVCQAWKDGSKDRTTYFIEKHLPSHRDFYRPDGENCKFYQQALQAGLEIKSVSLGLGTLHLMDLQQLYSMGMDLIRKDPRILLCDDENCFFCRKY